LLMDAFTGKLRTRNFFDLGVRHPNTLNGPSWAQHLDLLLEPLGLDGQQVFDVCAAGEDALQVDPAALHVDPHVEQSHDAVQLVLPAQGVLLKHLGDGGCGKKGKWNLP